MIWILWGYLIMAHVGFAGVAVVIAMEDEVRRDWQLYALAYAACMIWPISLVVAFKGGVL